MIGRLLAASVVPWGVRLAILNLNFRPAGRVTLDYLTVEQTASTNRTNGVIRCLAHFLRGNVPQHFRHIVFSGE